MRKHIAILIPVLAIAAGCHEHDVPPAPQEQQFVGVIDNGAARASLEFNKDLYSALWTAGDEIFVTDGTSSATLTADEGECCSSTFSLKTGEKPEGSHYTAYYPADLLDNMTLSAEREYALPPFDLSPMMAESDNNILPFKSLCGMLRINLTSLSEVMLKSLTIKADKGLSGPFTISDGMAVIEGDGAVTINCGDGVRISGEPTPFYLEIPAGKYGEISLVAFSVEGREYILDLPKIMTVERAALYRFDLSFDKLERQDAILMDGPSLNTQIKLATGLSEKDAAKNVTRIKRIEFVTGSSDSEGVEVQDPSSKKKIYAKYNASDSVVTISTSAAEFRIVPDASKLFSGISSLVGITNLEALNTTGVTSMESMFDGDSGLESLDVSSFDMSSCTTVLRMFYACRGLKEIDVTGWNTGKVTDMGFLFSNCSGLTKASLASLNTSNVTSFNSVFSGCQALEAVDLSGIDTHNATVFTSFFSGCNKLKDAGSLDFDVSSATDMKNFFFNCSSLENIDITSWIVDGSANLSYMFYGMTNIKELHLGSNVKLDSSNASTAIFTSAEQSSGYFGFASKKVTIYCSLAVKDWLITTSLRWIHSGYKTKQPVEITLIQWDSQGIIPVDSWPAN